VSLARVSAPLCARCGAPTAWPVARCIDCSGRRIAFASARAAVQYAGPARSLVQAWKERGLRPIAALAAELTTEVVPCPVADVITYIPPVGERSREGGYHPPELLARELAARWGLECVRLLGRARAAPRQTGLPLAERVRNVRGAFTATTEPPPAVVLVDDVYTSGATVSEAASTLRAAGARAVHALAFARAVR
jgi:ComF family protein